MTSHLVRRPSAPAVTTPGPNRFRSFDPKALAFLRALKRNNDREWFRARKARYDELLRQPMTALVERLAADLKTFAPQIVADPKSAIYRIYRDTRFSDDKTPLKTHIAASFPTRGLARHAGAGLYLEVAPGWVWVGGGMYAPETSQLQLVREHIAANHRQLRAIVESPGFVKGVGPLSGEQLQRTPRGFASDHPAAVYLKYRQFLAGRQFPAAFATSPRFYASVVGIFQLVAPLTAFLNEPLLGERAAASASSRRAGRRELGTSGEENPLD
ncbi:MAG: DUF2461 domain-containing protein [Vicinamibacterales bacterium]